MIARPWELIARVSVPARPSGLWTLAVEYLEAPALVQIVAASDQRWSYAKARHATCGADGDPTSLLSSAVCLCAKAPVGALIGKFGGSTAAAADGLSVFPAGTRCVVAVPDPGAALFLTINDQASGMANNDKEIAVTVWRTDAPAPRAGAPSSDGTASPPAAPPAA